MRRDSEENAVGLAVKLQELTRKAQAQQKGIQGFVILANGEAHRERVAKLAEANQITTINVSYLPASERSSVLRRLQIETTDRLRHVVPVCRDKKLAFKFVNLDAKSFAQVEKAFNALMQQGAPPSSAAG